MCHFSSKLGVAPTAARPGLYPAPRASARAHFRRVALMRMPPATAAAAAAERAAQPVRGPGGGGGRPDGGGGDDMRLAGAAAGPALRAGRAEGLCGRPALFATVVGPTLGPTPSRQPPRFRPARFAAWRVRGFLGVTCGPGSKPRARPILRQTRPAYSHPPTHPPATPWPAEPAGASSSSCAGRGRRSRLSAPPQRAMGRPCRFFLSSAFLSSVSLFPALCSAGPQGDRGGAEPGGRRHSDGWHNLTQGGLLSACQLH